MSTNTSFETDGNRLIDTIQDAVKTEILEVDGQKYLTREAFLPKQKPLVGVILCTGLTAVIDYLANALDAGARRDSFIHIVSPTQVEVVSQVDGREDRRFVALVAKADVPPIHVISVQSANHSFIEQEVAVIELQSKFIQEGDIAAVLDKLGHIVADEEITQTDSGVSQQVIIRRGVDAAREEVKNPVYLKPFRTFTEIDQPASPFILRLENEDGIRAALFEADGGAWRNEARASIKNYLASSLPDVTILA